LNSYEGRIIAERLDIDKIISDFQGVPSPVSTRMDAQLALEGTELHPGRVKMDGHISLQDLKADMPSSDNNSETRTAEIGLVNTSLSLDQGQINIDVSHSNSKIHVEGKLTDDGRLSMSVSADPINLAEVSSIATGVPTVRGKTEINADANMEIAEPGIRKMMGLSPIQQSSDFIQGISNLKAQVEISTPDIIIKPAGTDGEIAAGTLTGKLNLKDNLLEIQEIALRKDTTRTSIDGTVLLEEKPYLNAQLVIDSLNIQDYMTILGEQQIPVKGGMVNGKLTAEGRIDRIDGGGEINISQLVVADRPIDPVKIPVELNSGVVDINDMMISSENEYIKINFSMDQSGDYDFDVVSSDINLSGVIPENYAVSGLINVSVSGKGNLKSPAFDGNIEIVNLAYNDQAFSDLNCLFSLDKGKIHVDLSLSDQSLVAVFDSGIEFPFPYKARVKIDNINFDPLLNTAEISRNFKIGLVGSINAEGQGAYPEKSLVKANFLSLIIDAEGYKWSNNKPIEFTYENGKAKIESFNIENETSYISLNGQYTLNNNKLQGELKVSELNLTPISKMIPQVKTIDGKINYKAKFGGKLESPVILMTLSGSDINYEKINIRRISTQASYKKGKAELEELLVRTLGGEAKIKAMMPIEFNIMAPPTIEDIMGKPVYVSVDAKNFDLSMVKSFVPQLVKSRGKISEIHLEATGLPEYPRIGGYIKINNAEFQLESMPVPLENINGTFSVMSLDVTDPLSPDGTVDGLSMVKDLNYRNSVKSYPLDYELNGNIDWVMDNGSYNSEFSLRVPYWMLNGKNQLSSPVSRNGKPDFQFSMDIQDGQLGVFFKEFLKESDISADGSLSMNLALNGSFNKSDFWVFDSDISKRLSDTEKLLSEIKSLRGNINIDPVNVLVNDVGIKNYESIRFYIDKKGLNITEFQLNVTKSVDQKSKPKGSIAVSGTIDTDLNLKLNVLGQDINPDLASSFVNPPEAMGGNMGFRFLARGKLPKPIFRLFFEGNNLNIPISSTNGQTKIDKVILKARYNENNINVEDFQVDSFGNKIEANGLFPLELSLLPVSVNIPDKEVNFKMLMENFDLQFLKHISPQIQESKGKIEADIQVSGTVSKPNLKGNLNLADSTFRIIPIVPETEVEDSSAKPVPLNVENINLNITMNDEGIFMEETAFNIGEGHYEFSGNIQLGKQLMPQLYEISFKAAPAKLDPFVALGGPELAKLVSGEITIEGGLKGDFRKFLEGSMMDKVNSVSGQLLIADEGIKVNAAQHFFTNPKKMSVNFKDGKLNLSSFKLIDMTSQSEFSTSISAFGEWDIDGRKLFDATVNLDMELVSQFMQDPDLMGGWLAFKLQARGEEVEFFWPPENFNQKRPLKFGLAVLDKFEGRIVYRDKNISVEKISVSTGQNQMILSGNVPLNDELMEVQFDARLDDMGILSLINKGITESSGTGVVGATVTGNALEIASGKKSPHVVGFCRLDNLDINFESSNIKFEDIRTDIEFDSKSISDKQGFIALKNFRGKLNDGDFFLDKKQDTRAGVVILWEKGNVYNIGEIQDISIVMQNCALKQPMVFSMLFDGELMLKGRFDNPIITGNITVNRGEYTESLNSLIQKTFQSREIGFKAFLDYPLVQDLELDVNVQIPGDLRMENSLMNVEAQAAARVRGSLAGPLVFGQASIVEGEFAYFGRTFTITEGTIRNRAEINPEYDITAETEVQSDVADGVDDETFIVRIEIRGTLNERLPPSFTIVGEGVTQETPDLSEEEIISILALGATPEQLLNRASESSSSSPQMLAKWYLENQAEKRLNLTEFDIQIDPDNSKETRLVMAKQLMSQISVLVDVGYGGLERLGLEYELTKHLAISGEIQRKDWGLDLKAKRESPTISGLFDFLK
ncbi:hypothetical protein GF312_21395, partial [Candidatus Poribacteria bacterium]|nr:hypothetical protein [Candidatus Poribacteria bacterium]